MTTATENPALTALLGNPDAIKGALRTMMLDKELSKTLRNDPNFKELRKELSGPLNPGVRTESREAGHAEAMEIAKELGLLDHSHIGHIKQISSTLNGGNQNIKVLLELKGQVSKSGAVRVSIPAASFGGVTDPKFLAEIERVKRQQLKMALGGLAASGVEPAALEVKKDDVAAEETKTDAQ